MFIPVYTEATVELRGKKHKQEISKIKRNFMQHFLG